MSEKSRVDAYEIDSGCTPTCTPDAPLDVVPVRPPVRGRRWPAQGLSKGRLARLRLRTVHDLDKRTRSYRHAMETVAELVALFGGNPTAAQRSAIETVAMLEIVAADLVARQIAGMSVCLDECLRASSAARRARRALLADKPEPEPEVSPGVEYARKRWAAQDAARAAAAAKDNASE